MLARFCAKIFASPFPHHRNPAPSPSSQQQDLELTGLACLQEKRAREEMLQKQSIREQIWKEESPNKVPVYGSVLSVWLVGCMYNKQPVLHVSSSLATSSAQHGTTCHGIAQHDTAWRIMTQHGTVLHSVAQHDTAWANMAHEGTAWHNMTQHGTAWHSMVHRGTKWPNMAQRGTALPSMIH